MHGVFLRCSHQGSSYNSGSSATEHSFMKLIVDGKPLGDLAGQIMQKCGKSVRVLRYAYHVRHNTEKHAVNTAFCCASSYFIFNRTAILERKLTDCRGRVTYAYLRKFYQKRENFFDRLDPYGIEYTDEYTVV